MLARPEPVLVVQLSLPGFGLIPASTHTGSLVTAAAPPTLSLPLRESPTIIHVAVNLRTMAQAGPSKPTTEKLTLTPDIIKRLRPAIVDPKTFTSDPSTWQPSAYKGYYPKPLVESISFDDAGEQCVVAGEDEAFTVWDTVNGV